MGVLADLWKHCGELTYINHPKNLFNFTLVFCCLFLICSDGSVERYGEFTNIIDSPGLSTTTLLMYNTGIAFPTRISSELLRGKSLQLQDAVFL